MSVRNFTSRAKNITKTEIISKKSASSTAGEEDSNGNGLKRYRINIRDYQLNPKLVKDVWFEQVPFSSQLSLRSQSKPGKSL